MHSRSPDEVVVPDLTQGQRVTSAVRAITEGNGARLPSSGSEVPGEIHRGQFNLNFRYRADNVFTESMSQILCGMYLYEKKMTDFQKIWNTHLTGGPVFLLLKSGYPEVVLEACLWKQRGTQILPPGVGPGLSKAGIWGVGGGKAGFQGRSEIGSSRDRALF